MTQKHQVWAAPPGKVRQVLYATYSLRRWQWAEKLAAYLRDKGGTRVEVRTVEADGDDESDD